MEAMMSEQITGLMESLSQMEEDIALPKNVRTKIKSAMEALQESGKDNRIKANKALQALDDISDDPNIPAYMRPQIWNIVSLLEGF